MPAWKVPLADVVVTDDDLAAVVDTYRSGWLSMGPRTAAFEEAFAAHVGVPHAFAVANGTAALHLMCLAMELGPGDEVIVPSLTFVATANAVLYAGATPVFADIAGPLEPWLSPEAVEAAITPRTRAILYVDYGGHPGSLAALLDIADRRGITLVQDAAHAIGSRLGGTEVGALGLASAYSFFSNKNLAIGEGGMLVTQDSGLADRVRLLRSHGMTTLTWDRHRGHASGYDVVALGFNYRLDEPRAALGQRRLARLDADNARRGELTERYRDALEGVVECTMAPVAGATSAHHLFTILLEPGADRDAFRAALTERGVQTSVHYPPVHTFSIHASQDQELPVTDDHAARTVTLPLFPHMTHEQQDHVVSAVAAALAGPARAHVEAPS
jgi:dTDP-4-amino-4,6-dideoxygalactose transaminase